MRLSRVQEEEIFARDDYTCRGCKRRFPTKFQLPPDQVNKQNHLVVDHIDGPSPDPSNLQTLCQSCNGSKAGRNGNSFRLSVALKSLGPCVVYYPSLSQLVGLKESIFLCQLIYWTPKGRHEKGDGWIYKSATEMTQETGLSYKEQIRLRSALVSKGLLAENYVRDEHRLYFKVNTEALDSLAQHLPNRQMPDGHMATARKDEATLPKVSSIKETETTKDHTESTKTKAQAPFALPVWIPQENWDGFEEMRKKIRKPMTDRARAMIATELFKLKNRGHPPGPVLDQSTRNCWQDVFELRDKTNGNGASKVEQRNARNRDAIIQGSKDYLHRATAGPHGAAVRPGGDAGGHGAMAGSPLWPNPKTDS